MIKGLYKEIPDGQSKEDRADLFSVVPTESTEGNGQKLKHREFHLNIKCFLLRGWLKTRTDCPERVSILGYIQHPIGHNPEHHTLVDSALSSRVWTG